eukprot:160208-Pleurochrysis_carterae.AAC.1
MAVSAASRDASPTASATPHVPNSSAAGMDSTGRPSGPAPLRSSARSAAVVAPLRSASSTSAGHTSDTSNA